MMQTGAVAAVFTLMAGLAAAQTPATARDFAGTWNLTVMSHQVALVIEAVDETRVTATLMMPGRDIALKGEVSGRAIELVGVKPAASAAQADTASAPASQDGHDGTMPPPRPITVTLEEDGTLTGEMMTTQGPVAWTGERLRPRKG
ncbi:MAG: hypothetical protein R2745_01015 [Vicinamibacterales bacterium]